MLAFPPYIRHMMIECVEGQDAVEKRYTAMLRRSLLILPSDMEQAFWTSRDMRRVLLATDTLACVLGLVQTSMSVYRITAAQPDQSMFSIIIGPNNFLFSLGAVACVFLLLPAAVLLLMLLQPRGYHKHRTALCVLNRMIRLIYSSAVLMWAAGMAHLARAVAVKTADLSANPLKALLLNVLHPAVWCMQHANWVLPWRWAIPLQMLTFVAVVNWSRWLPCLIQITQPIGPAGGVFYQQEAVAACEVLQVLASFVRIAAGDPAFLLRSNVCYGLVAVQTLQLFAGIVCVLILPLVIIYCTERYMKTRFVGDLQASSAAAAAPVGDDTFLYQFSRPADEGSSFMGNVLCYFALGFLLLMGAWMVSESFVGEWRGSLECAVLYAAFAEQCMAQ